MKKKNLAQHFLGGRGQNSPSTICLTICILFTKTVCQKNDKTFGLIFFWGGGMPPSPQCPLPNQLLHHLLIKICNFFFKCWPTIFLRWRGQKSLNTPCLTNCILFTKKFQKNLQKNFCLIFFLGGEG